AGETPAVPAEGASEPEHHQDHVLPELGRLRKGAFVPAEPAAEDQRDILFAVHRICHRRAGERGAGFEAPQLGHGVLIECRYLAHDVAHEKQAAVGAQHTRIGRIVGLEFLHRVAGANVDAAEQAVAHFAVGIAHAPLDWLYGVLFGGDAAVNFPKAGAYELLGRVGGTRVEVVGFADHGVEVGDAAR